MDDRWADLAHMLQYICFLLLTGCSSAAYFAMAIVQLRRGYNDGRRQRHYRATDPFVFWFGVCFRISVGALLAIPFLYGVITGEVIPSQAK
jgi:hypothetical protein